MTELITNGTGTRYRKAAGAFVNGRWVAGSSTSATVVMALQPEVMGEDTKEALFGDRKAFICKGYIDTAFSDGTTDIRGVDQFGQEDADEITHTAFPGDRFRVIRVWDWRSQPFLPHVKFQAIRLDEAKKGTT